MRVTFSYDKQNKELAEVHCDTEQEVLETAKHLEKNGYYNVTTIFEKQSPRTYFKRSAIAQSMLARPEENFVTIEIQDDSLELYDSISIGNESYCIIGHFDGIYHYFVKGHMEIDEIKIHDMNIPYRKLV